MPNARALLVGINYCDKDAYGGDWDGRLEFCESDAECVAEITQGCGFQNTLLLSAEGTKERVMQEIREASGALNAGDAFMFFYSGHGHHQKDKDSDEGNGRDETMCLHDGQLIDDELYALWQQFDPGVRISVVTDCCHSGSMMRDGESDDVPKGMDDEVGELLTFIDPDMFARMRADLPPKSDLQASIIHIAGCHEDQKSYENRTKKHGRLTAALMETWVEGPIGSYAELYKRMFERMPDKQKPVLAILGADSARVDTEPPFSI